VAFTPEQWREQRRGSRFYEHAGRGRAPACGERRAEHRRASDVRTLFGMFGLVVLAAIGIVSRETRNGATISNALIFSSAEFS